MNFKLSRYYFRGNVNNGFLRSRFSTIRKYSNGEVVNNIADDVVPVWTGDHAEDGICWIKEFSRFYFEV